MKYIKTLLITMLTALLALPGIAQDFEYAGIWYTVLDAEAKTVKTKDGYYDSDKQDYFSVNNCKGDLTIPSIVPYGNNDYSVVEIGNRAFGNCSELTTVVLPESVTSIGIAAFGNCSNLTSINIPNGVTSIDNSTFYLCKSLTSIDIPDGVTSIGWLAFHWCSSLTSIDIPDGVTSIGIGAFSGCTSLTSINIPEGVTVIEDRTFQYCNELMSINIPNSVTLIGESAFEDCSSFTTISIPAGVISIGSGAFDGCGNIKEVKYNATSLIKAPEDVFTYIVYANATLQTPNATLADIQATVPWNKFSHVIAKDGTAGFVSSGDDFEYEGLWYTVLDPDAKTVKTKEGHGDINEIHYEEWTPGNNCEGEVTVPAIVSDGTNDYTVVGIGDYSFCHCSSLTSINIPDGLTSIGECSFAGCTSLTTINIPDGVTLIGDYSFLNCESLTTINIPDGVTLIGDGAFGNCESLTTINIPDGVTSIEYGAFYGCSSLTEIHLPASLEEIGSEAFGSNDKLSSIIYEASSPILTEPIFSDRVYRRAVLRMDNATLSDIQATESWNRFYHIVAKDGEIQITPPLYAGDDFEYEGIWYTVLDSEAKTVKTKDGNWNYEPGNSYVGDLVIPATVSDGASNYKVVEIGFRSFVDCRDITSVILPETLITIQEGAFEYCGAPSIDFPKSLQEIGHSAFSGASLNSLILPEDLKVVGPYAFWSNTDLESVVFPASLEEIGDCSFDHCVNVTSVIYNAVDPISCTPDLFGYGDVYNNAILTMPNATLASIQAVEPWSKFKNIVAKDGVIPHHFEYQGIWYTVLDAEAKTCKTKDGYWGDGAVPGNSWHGDLIIPESVSDGSDNYSVIAIGEFGFANCEDLTSLVLPNSMVTIEDNAFRGCKSLASVELPQTLEVIGGWSFSFCDALRNINLPESLTTLGDASFSDCVALTSISIPESITRIGDMTFHACYSLTSLYLHDKLEVIGGYAFAWCPVTAIDLPNSLKTIGHFAFAGNSIRSLVVPESVTSIGGNAFCWCGDLSEIHLPASLEEIGSEAFGSNDKLSSIIYEASSPILTEPIFSDRVYQRAVLRMDNATLSDIQATESWNRFYHIVAKDGEIQITPPLYADDDFEYEGIWYTVLDSEAKTVKTKDGHVEEGDVKIPANNCAGQLIIPERVYFEGDEYTVTEIGYTSFARNLELTDVILPASITRITQDGFYGCPELISIQFPDNLLSIGQGAFYNCEKLESVSLPSTLESMDWAAFIGCRNIVTVNYYATEPISADWGSFDDETYYHATLDMPNATLADIQEVEPWNRFRNIIAKDGSIVSSLNPGDDFEYDGLVYTVLDSEARTVQTKAGHRTGGDYGRRIEETTESAGMQKTGHFGVTGYTIPGNYCEGELEIPAIVSDGQVEYTVIGIGTDGFHDCVNLKTVKFPETLEFIGEASFEDAGLTSLNLPNSLTEIVHSAFISCDSIKTIVFPESLKKIGDVAFYGCNGIESVTFPSGIEEIGWSVFDSCYNVKTVTYNAELPIHTGGFFVDEIYDNATLIMPNATLADVKATESWNYFRHVIAKDGTAGFVSSGEDFEYEGLWYTVIDAVGKTCRTLSGSIEEGRPGNAAEGNLVIPATVSYDGLEYTVTEIGNCGFRGNPNLFSVTVPGSVARVGIDAFSGCERLTSLIWRGNSAMPDDVSNAFDNPNLLIYVDDPAYAPRNRDHNVVAEGVCERLVLTPGYAFTPCADFTANYCIMTKEFTQQTSYDGCSGWETIVVPFDVARVSSPQGNVLLPFSVVSDVARQRPYWLYEADPEGEWKASDGIRAGVPYLIAMPNNPRYNPAYNISGPVTFSNATPQEISTGVTAPYAVTWTSGREFRPLWLPLTDSEAADAMGINVNMTDLRDEYGTYLAPGSAFCADVLPKPLEAYVTRIDGRRAIPVHGGQTFVGMLNAEDGLRIVADQGAIILSSDSDMTVDVMTMEGIVIRRANLKAGETYRIDNLTRGFYIVAERKITVK